MALYNPGGDAKPIVKFDAKEGKLKIDDGVIDLKKFKAIFDLEGLELGYCRFNEGAAPDWRMAPATNEQAVKALQRPEGSEARPYKWGFRLNLKLTKELANGAPDIREFASNSYVTLNGIDQLHDDWMAEKNNHPGKLPVVTGKSMTTIPGKFGRLYQPVFMIAGWIDAPKDLIAARNGNGDKPKAKGAPAPG